MPLGNFGHAAEQHEQIDLAHGTHGASSVIGMANNKKVGSNCFICINSMENSKFRNYTRKTLLIYVRAVFSAVTQPNVIVLIISKHCSFTYEQCCVGEADAAY